MPLTPGELLATTRSVRRRLDLTRPVPPGPVQECPEIARQAPDGGRRAGWHRVVVTDPRVRAQIGDFRQACLARRRRGHGTCIMVRPAWPAGETQAGLRGSLLPAAWSYMLACRSRGLRTAWTTLHLHYETEIAALPGLPGDIRQGALIPAAYCTRDTFRPAARRPLADVLHADHW